MTNVPVPISEVTEDNSFSSVLTMADMLTVQISLQQPGHELMLAMPRAEWLKLVSDFVKMPADERQRVGVSIREATAEDPFPTDGEVLTPKQQRKCDVFVNDCILLAALAETVGERILLDTAVEGYKVVPGLPDLGRMKGRFN
jgi:hypothetical protein